ncbi:leucine-rich PPR motif-containing protein, mitochondrial isoform X2 [Euwallacea similis]|uniref:leucine-rich PPR motif-containing protein, mitochondrial isoform X2 n=1 Tax=Euwallacea similis TaxID=1736056 RepID=UPI00344FAFBF
MQRLVKCFPGSYDITRFTLYEIPNKGAHMKRFIKMSPIVKIRNYSQYGENIQFMSENNLKIYSTKFNIDDLLMRIYKGKVFYLKQLRNVFHTIQFDKLKNQDAEILLKLCGSLVADSSRKQRNEVCQDIFQQLQKANNINADILNRYIKTCTENNVFAFNEQLFEGELNENTYSLLLENVCHLGKIEQALGILESMKNKDFALDSSNISSLVLVHTINGGLKSGEAVLDTIRTAKIFESNSAKMALYKGLIRRGNIEEFRKAIKLYPLGLEKNDLLLIIEELGLKGLESWLDDLYPQYKHISLTREMENDIEKICIHLIHMEQPNSAMNIYEWFIKPKTDINYGYNILKEMLHCNIDMSVIIGIAKNLTDKGSNEYILEGLTWLALRFKYEEQAWILLSTLHILRPHYFWPLLLQSAQNKGHQGIFSTLKRIKDYNVKLDSESLEFYIIPHCDLTNLKLLLLKLQEAGFTVREIISPLIAVLLKSNKTKWAADLSAQYNVNICGTGFLAQLARSWVSTRDSTSTVTLLARYCESNPSVEDFVGMFLIHAAKFCGRPNTLQEYLNLVLLIGRQRLKLTSHSAEIIQDLCRPFLCSNSKLHKDFDMKVNALIDIGLNLPEDSALPHPKNMDLDSLEGHLVELQEKNMETRGVLRKLILLHASKGNIQRVEKLRQLFSNSGYEESPGMKSSIMHSWATADCLDDAMNLYDELKIVHSRFDLDSFKIIDLVKLLVKHDRFEEGFYILEKELKKCKKMGNTRAIERNCRELLDACKTAEQVEKTFNLLYENNLCKASNVILGPFVKIHLRSGNFDEAVRQYLELSKKHQCTPFQLEVLRVATKQENVSQLEKLLKATEEVHGVGVAQVGLIAALAENGQDKALRNTILSCTHPVSKLLQKRCSRWVLERKIEPLMCLAKTCNRLSQKLVDIDFVNNCIVELYDLNADSEGATEFLNNLPEEARTCTLEEKVFQICGNNN